MSGIHTLSLKKPATLEAVLEAVVKLSAYDESEILELVSAGKLRELFPLRPAKVAETEPDFVAQEDLVEASASPLSRSDRKRIIESSMRSQGSNSASAQAEADFVAFAEMLETTSAG